MMRAQVEKSQAGSSQANAATAHLPVAMKATGAVENLRATSVAQRKLQQVISDKMQTPKSLVKQARDAGKASYEKKVVNQFCTPVQLKLKKKAFNLVGEDHDESNARRDEEFLFSIFAVRSKNYWQEGEFKLKKTNGSFILGDKAFLRAGQAVQIVFDYHNDYCANLEVLLAEISKSEPESDFAELTETMMAMANQRNKFICYAIDELKREESIGKNSRYAPLRRYMEDLLSLRMDILLLEDAEGYVSLRGKENDLKSANAKFSAELQEVFKVYTITENNDVTESLSSERDIWINTIANKAQELGITGVWKVGEDHIDGIKRLGLNITYNLVSQSEFNDEYKKDELAQEEEEARIRKKYKLK